MHASVQFAADWAIYVKSVQTVRNAQKITRSTEEEYLRSDTDNWQAIT